MAPYTDSFFTASIAIATTLLAVLVVLRAELRWRALVLAAATLPVFAAPFVAGYTPSLGLLDVILLTLVAVVAGAAIRAPSSPSRGSSRRTWLLDDAAVFTLAVVLAALVSDQVLERYTVSGDEWADVYQADLFAHLRSYGAPRACPAVFRNWWVFERAGRTFAQYTPGWPLGMAPFQRVGAVWLAGPFTFGAVAVGVARLARRVAGASAPRIAGIVAPLFLAASPSALLNGASLYPHTMVCACFAWTVESLVVEAPKRRGTIAWGVALGSASALMVAARPMDGVALLVGIAAIAYLARLAPTRAGLLAATLSAAAWGLLVLVILHAQLGVWFATAYAMSPIRMALSIPELRELAYAVPFDRATPYWWPCALPIVPFGILVARGRGRAVAGALTLGAILLVVAYALLDAGRDGAESGYGSRFHLPLVVPMAVAAGVLVSWLVERVFHARGHGRWIDALATATVVLTAIEGVVVIAPTIYPSWHATLHRDHALRRAIAESGIHHAVVVVHQADLAQEVWDLTQNLPSEPEPDVLVLTDWHAEDDFACARRVYAERSWFIARGHERVVLSDYDPRTDDSR